MLARTHSRGVEQRACRVKVWGALQGGGVITLNENARFTYAETVHGWRQNNLCSILDECTQGVNTGCHAGHLPASFVKVEILRHNIVVPNNSDAEIDKCVG